MSTNVNRRWLLASRPSGLVEKQNFQWVEEPVPSIADGEILVKVLFLSCDPTQRGWIARDTYMPAVKIGEVVRSGGLGRVVASKSEAYKEGDLVSGLVGWQDYVVLKAGGMFPPAKVPNNVPIPMAMGTFGLTGLTAYFGLLEIGQPKPGETVLVSGAAGATGSIVGQIARIKGARAIGIAGGKEKCEWLVNEAKFDAAIDYKSEDVSKRVRELAPKGVDVYFDNVGGEQLDIALANLAMHARVVICGAISQYDSTTPVGPKNYMNLLVKRSKMEGFLVADFMGKAGDAIRELAGWVGEGKIKDRFDIAEGLENAPEALRRLFTGENKGKQLVKIAD
ncbi:MAG TPA: NADP-dependent oxidoreductase [Polyangiaceae bacterium]